MSYRDCLARIEARGLGTVVPAAVLAAAGIAGSASASDAYWVGYQNDCMLEYPNEASFFHDENWYGYEIPGEDDAALFGTGFDPAADGWPTYIYFGDVCIDVDDCPETVYVPGGDAGVARLEIQDGTWTFDFGPGAIGSCSDPGETCGSLSVIGGVEPLVIGDLVDETQLPGSVDLTIINGTVSFPFAWLAAVDGAEAQVTLDGAGAAFNATDFIDIGYEGAGTLTVENGASVHADGWISVGAFEGSTGRLIVDDESSSVTTDGWVDVGVWGDGELILSNGAQLANNGGAIGARDTGVGNALLTGPGTHWTSSQVGSEATFWVGFEGEGELHIENGAQLSSLTDSAWTIVGGFEGSAGKVFVTGEGSEFFIPSERLALAHAIGTTAQLTISDAGEVVSGSFLSAGAEGQATVTITGGGRLICYGPAEIGHWSNGVADVLVSGAGSQFLMNGDWGLHVPWLGTGTLRIEDGGEVVSSSLNHPIIIGGPPVDGGRGEVIVTGAGSAMRSPDLQLHVGGGSGSEGKLVVEKGGYVHCDVGVSDTIAAVVGRDAGAYGEAFVTDAGSVWDNTGGKLYVGYYGTGELYVIDGGELASEGGVIGTYDGSDGAVTILGPGATWTCDGDINIGEKGQGRLTVLDGGRVTAGKIMLFDQLTGDGTLQAFIKNSGQIDPGYDIGTLDVVGDVHQSTAGTLHIQIAGTTPDIKHDVLDVTGSATVGGTLSIEFTDGYEPEPGESYTLLLATSVSGRYDTLVSDVVIKLFYETDRVIARVFDEQCPGDVTYDGVTDVLDIIAVLESWGETGAGLPADIFVDGVVDVVDLLVLLSGWGPCE